MASIAIVWSIPPVGAPATSASARMHAATRSRRTPAVSSRPVRPATATATAHSRAAEEESPAPNGTVLSRTRSRPVTSRPCSRIAHSTPAA